MIYMLLEKNAFDLIAFFSQCRAEVDSIKSKYVNKMPIKMKKQRAYTPFHMLLSAQRVRNTPLIVCYVPPAHKRVFMLELRVA